MGVPPAEIQNWSKTLKVLDLFGSSTNWFWIWRCLWIQKHPEFGLLPFLNASIEFASKNCWDIFLTWGINLGVQLGMSICMQLRRCVTSAERSPKCFHHSPTAQNHTLGVNCSIFGWVKALFTTQWHDRLSLWRSMKKWKSRVLCRTRRLAS